MRVNLHFNPNRHEDMVIWNYLSTKDKKGTYIKELLYNLITNGPTPTVPQPPPQNQTLDIDTLKEMLSKLSKDTTEPKKNKVIEEQKFTEEEIANMPDI